jgi:hypothetical protein
MTQFGWGMAEGVIPELMGPVMDQQVSALGQNYFVLILIA